LQQVLRIYTIGGLWVTTICCDNEFHPLMDPLALEVRIQVNYASPQEHVPEAEHNNQVIKEWIRATYHCLPYDCMPRIMVKVLVNDSAKKLNFFPAKNGISQYYSPRMILHQQNLDILWGESTEPTKGVMKHTYKVVLYNYCLMQYCCILFYQLVSREGCNPNQWEKVSKSMDSSSTGNR
jgi:hypothetical protein